MSHAKMTSNLSFHPSRDFLGMPLPIWFLSLGMFFLNFSSVMIFICMPLLPRYFPVRTSSIGSLEGVAEGFSLLIRAFSGLLSDFTRKRKRFVLIGYGICFIARMLLAVASVFETVILSRFLEKLGNGIQASPREALISDLSGPKVLGRAYGLNKALGMLGSSAGSILLIFLFYWNESFSLKAIFLCAGVLAFFSLFLLLAGVEEPKVLDVKPSTLPRHTFQTFLKEVRSFSFDFWKAISLCFFIKMGYFSGTYMAIYVMLQKMPSFLGFSMENKPLISAVIMTLQNILCALLSYPVGFLSDSKGRRLMVGAGIVTLLGSLLCFGLGSGSPLCIVLGVGFYGVQYSMQGALLAFMSSTMPKKLQGTGFGIFFVTIGSAVIISNSFFMKTIWDAYSPAKAFLVICIPVGIALCILPFVSLKNTKEEPLEIL